VEKKADQVLEDVVQALVGGRHPVGDEGKTERLPKRPLQAKGLFGPSTADSSAQEGDEHVIVADNPETIFQLFQARGWADGLPFIPPKEERVARMLSYADRAPKEVVAVLPPRWGEATVEKIAVNAVMAGCLPQYFPVVMTAISAIAEKSFNLYAVQATTHPCSPLILVNGPLAQELNINGRYNALGQGWRANATIGRAVRLVMLNIGGGGPGVLDRATLGQPGKYSYCLAENETENPWMPLHVEKGFPKEVSTVTVFGAEAPHNINDHRSTTARDILKTIVHTIAVPGCNNAVTGGEFLLLLGPEHAATIAGDGFSKEDVKKFLYEEARVPVEHFPAVGWQWIMKMRPHWEEAFEKKGRIPLVDRWEEVQVAVAGGAGKHSAFIPTFGATKSVTKAIARKDGQPVLSIKEFKGKGDAGAARG
jgi:hypothetical protein